MRDKQEDKYRICRGCKFWRGGLCIMKGQLWRKDKKGKDKIPKRWCGYKKPSLVP